MAEFSKYEIERPFKRQLSDKKLMKQLKAWGAKKRKTVDDGGRSKVRMRSFDQRESWSLS